MKKTILIFVFALSGIMVFGQKKDEAEKVVAEGVAFHDKGEYEKAIAKYDKALDLDKDNLMAMLEKALTLESMDRHQESIDYCKKAIKLYPDDENLNSMYVTYGNALDGMNKSKEAIEIYDQGIAKFPTFYQLYFNKGITLTGDNDYDEALLSFNKAVVCNPKHASSHNAIARLLYAKNKRIPALLALCRFFTLEPEGARAKSNVDLLEQMLGSNVEKTGKNAITINVNAGMLGDTLENGKPKENSFSTTDLILTMSSALDFDKKNSKKGKPEMFTKNFETVCASLKEVQKDNYGFYWEYYVPYFIEMKDNGLIGTFSYLVYASSDEASVSKWLQSHETELKTFYLWSLKYTWPEK